MSYSDFDTAVLVNMTAESPFLEQFDSNKGLRLSLKYRHIINYKCHTLKVVFVLP